MKIVVIGAGFVGLSNALLLSRKYNVTLYDISQERVDMINNKVPPYQDSHMSEFFATEKLNITATTNNDNLYTDCDYIVIALPTNYSVELNKFDMSVIDDTLFSIKESNTNAMVIIKSTIPIGYCDSMIEKTGLDIVFSPEFLREGTALNDNLYPSRVVIGSNDVRAVKFGNMLIECSNDNSVPLHITKNKEAEAIKLFSNAYLALRIAYINEVDTYCEQFGMETKSVITGMGLDKRIGSHYMNPSFGYGGYCYTKDCQQVIYDFKDTPNSIMSNIHVSNEIKKKVIFNNIMKMQSKTVGIYKLIMKTGVDNFRNSSVFDIANMLVESGVEVIVYEPLIESHDLYRVVNNFEEFENQSDVILANRMDDLISTSKKVYSRDCFGVDV